MEYSVVVDVFLYGFVQHYVGEPDRRRLFEQAVEVRAAAGGHYLHVLVPQWIIQAYLFFYVLHEPINAVVAEYRDDAAFVIRGINEYPVAEGEDYPSFGEDFGTAGGVVLEFPSSIFFFPTVAGDGLQVFLNGVAHDHE